MAALQRNGLSCPFPCSQVKYQISDVIYREKDKVGWRYSEPSYTTFLNLFPIFLRIPKHEYSETAAQDWVYAVKVSYSTLLQEKW